MHCMHVLTHYKKYISANTLILKTIRHPEVQDGNFMLSRPVIQALKRLSEEDYQEFEIILSYVVCFGPVWAIE